MLPTELPDSAGGTGTTFLWDWQRKQGCWKVAKEKTQTSQLNCVSKWEWACIIIWIFYPLTATAGAQSKAELTKICRKCSSALSILLAKEPELLLGDEAEEEEPVQRNGENSALQSSVLGGNKGKTVSPLAIHPLHLSSLLAHQFLQLTQEPKKSYSMCSEMLLDQGRKLLERFFSLERGSSSPAGETGPQGMCLTANFLPLQQHLSLIQSVSTSSQFYWHLAVEMLWFLLFVVCHGEQRDVRPSLGLKALRNSAKFSWVCIAWCGVTTKKWNPSESFEECAEKGDNGTLNLGGAEVSPQGMFLAKAVIQNVPNKWYQVLSVSIAVEKNLK